MSYRERRREAHTQAEQKRRDAIKKGYDYLMDLVPTNNSDGDADEAEDKVSKAAVLQRAIDYIGQVQGQKRQREEELAMLKKEVVALEIMKNNYESLVEAHQNQQRLQRQQQRPKSSPSYVPAEVKAKAFTRFMDRLFDSFNAQVGVDNFSELSGGVFAWFEESCKPQQLQDVMYETLSEVQQEYNRQQVPE